MPYIDHIDPINRDIYLHADTVSMATIHPIEIYWEMRTLRRVDESLRRYRLFMEARGNDPMGGGKATERYVRLLNGTRIVPYDASHALTIVGIIITDDGQSGISCFDRTPLSSTTRVDINYAPPQVEVITVSGGSGLSSDERVKLMSIPTAPANASAVWSYER